MVRDTEPAAIAWASDTASHLTSVNSNTVTVTMIQF